MDGVVDGAFHHDYFATLCPKLMGQTPEDTASDGRFDGLIRYGTVPLGENATMLRGCTSPLLTIYAQQPTILGLFSAVTCDNAQGIEFALDPLIGIRHRRIAFARQRAMEFSESNLWRDAFLAEMGRRGLRVDHDLSIPMGEDRASRNGELGAELIRSALAHGMKVPDDVFAVDLDSTSFCNELRPSLKANLPIP